MVSITNSMDMSMVENRAVWCAAEVSKSQT